jgi:stage III sporulation protein AG
MGKIKDFVEKIKSIKNIELYVAFVLAFVLLLTVLVVPQISQKTFKNDAASQSYIAEMENKLITVLGNIEGCGKVNVAISYATDGKRVYAYESTTKQDGDVTVQTSSLITIKGEPLLIETLTPQILGVVVVAEGANDPLVRYKIKQAVVTLLDIESYCVQVFS